MPSMPRSANCRLEADRKVHERGDESPNPVTGNTRGNQKEKS